MAPAYAANMAPPFVRFWRGWNGPICERWLGSHKTVVGAALGVVAAVGVTSVQSRLDWSGDLVADDRWPELGVRFGVGAMAGDVLKSYVKRRRGIRPGSSWVPADQLDFVLGALALVGSRAGLARADIATILALSFVGHIAVNHAACALGIRDTRW